MNIKTRLIAAACLLELAGYGALLFHSHTTSRDALMESRERQLHAQILDRTHRIDALTGSMENKAVELAEAGAMVHALSKELPEEQLERAVRDYLTDVFGNFPQSIGGGLWYEPGVIGADRRLYGPYVYWSDEQKVQFTWELSSEQYNYLQQDWYLTALPEDWPRDQKRPRRVYWTTPYWDEAGSEQLMMTVDAVMYDRDDRVIGLSTVDWSLREMTAFVSSLSVTQNSQTFLIDTRSGKVLSNTIAPQTVMQNFASVGWMADRDFTRFPNGEMQYEKRVLVGGVPYHLYSSLSESGLAMGVLIPDEEIYGEVDRFLENVTIGGLVIIALFVMTMLLLLHVMFRPFQEVTELIRRSIRKGRGDSLEVTPVVYDAHNELTPIVDSLNLVFGQINRYTEEVDRANKAKTTFLATMSHEIRTPMNAILGYAEILTSDPDLPEKHQDTLKAIENSGKHLLSLLTDVLDITKIESGGMTLYLENHYLRDVLQASEKVFSMRCQQKNIDWSSDIEVDADTIACFDKAKLNQVVFNLLGNATKFTVTGRVHMQAHYTNYVLRLTVADTGPGITPENQERLFTPFYQGSAGLDQGGTGLGLAIVKSLVELMGGAIRLADTSALGSVFEAEIPLGPKRKDLPMPKRNPLAGTTDFSRFQMSALVVDDVPMNRDILAKVLERLGIISVQAGDGVDALNILKSVEPDLLFIDIQMPIMDGWELLDNIKSQYPEYLPYTVAISANIQSHNNDLVENGFKYAVSKPFQIKDINHIVEQVVIARFSVDEAGNGTH